MSDTSEDRTLHNVTSDHGLLNEVDGGSYTDNVAHKNYRIHSMKTHGMVRRACDACDIYVCVHVHTLTKYIYICFYHRSFTHICRDSSTHTHNHTSIYTYLSISVSHPIAGFGLVISNGGIQVRPSGEYPSGTVMATRVMCSYPA